MDHRDATILKPTASLVLLLLLALSDPVGRITAAPIHHRRTAGLTPQRRRIANQRITDELRQPETAFRYVTYPGYRLSGHRVLDHVGGGGSRFHLRWGRNEAYPTVFHFQVEVAAHGYFGLGFNDRGEMAGADMVIGWIDERGEILLEDRYGVSDTVSPVRDREHNLRLLMGYENATHTVINWMRSTDTRDDFGQDYVFRPGPVQVLWAFTDKDPVGFTPGHHDRSGHVTMDLYDASTSTISSPAHSLSTTRPPPPSTRTQGATSRPSIRTSIPPSSTSQSQTSSPSISTSHTSPGTSSSLRMTSTTPLLASKAASISTRPSSLLELLVTSTVASSSSDRSTQMTSKSSTSAIKYGTSTSARPFSSMEHLETPISMSSASIGTTRPSDMTSKSSSSASYAASTSSAEPFPSRKPWVASPSASNASSPTVSRLSDMTSTFSSSTKSATSLSTGSFSSAVHPATPTLAPSASTAGASRSSGMALKSFLSANYAASALTGPSSSSTKHLSVSTWGSSTSIAPSPSSQVSSPIPARPLDSTTVGNKRMK